MSDFVIQRDLNRASSQGFTALLKDVWSVLKIRCDVPVPRQTPIRMQVVRTLQIAVYVLSSYLLSLSAYTTYRTFEVLICTFHAYLGVHCIVLHTTGFIVQNQVTKSEVRSISSPEKLLRGTRNQNKIHPDLPRSFAFRCRWNMWTDFCLLSEFQFSPHLT